jgi:tRNA/rRNA methyltransferase
MGRQNKGSLLDRPAPAVILVNPQLGENIGMAARAMLNCGLTELRLVAPRDGWPNPAAERAASGADIVLGGARVYDTTADAIADLHRVFATTARPRDLAMRVVHPRHAAGELAAILARGERAGVLFGRERTGLENDDLVLADTVISIPLNPDFSSLNIAQAVLLVAYEWALLQTDMPDETLVMHDTRPATREEVVGFFGQLEAALDDAEFWRVPEKRPGMVRNIRAMFERAYLTEQEVRTLRGIVKSLAEHRVSRRRVRGAVTTPARKKE